MFSIRWRVVADHVRSSARVPDRYKLLCASPPKRYNAGAQATIRAQKQAIYQLKDGSNLRDESQIGAANGTIYRKCSPAGAQKDP